MCNSKTIKICPNLHTNLLRFLFTEDALKIKKGLELVSWPYLSYCINWPNFIANCVFFPNYLAECFSGI